MNNSRVVKVSVAGVVRRAARDSDSIKWVIAILLAGVLVGVLIVRPGRGRNAAHRNAIASTLQTVRGQIELYKMQHGDLPPEVSRLWVQLANASNQAGGTTEGGVSAAYPYGPYIQGAPVNPINGQSGAGEVPSAGVGWVYQVSGSQCTVQAVNGAGDGVLTY